MEKNSGTMSKAKTPTDRKKRLKAALKANMGRRKAQAQARKASVKAEQGR